MGSSIAKTLESLHSTQYHLVMLGLDGAGKTTVLYRLKFDQYVNTVPTLGFNCEKVKPSSGKAKGVTFTVWDVGGQDKLRPLWGTYTKNTDGIIFVVDSTDKERMEEAKCEILKIVKGADSPAGVPVLVLANKQDLRNALETHVIERMLNLEDLSPQHLWNLEPACAIIGDGLDEGIESLYEMILKRKKAKSNKKKR